MRKIPSILILLAESFDYSVRYQRAVSCGDWTVHGRRSDGYGDCEVFAERRDRSLQAQVPGWDREHLPAGQGEEASSGKINVLDHSIPRPTAPRRNICNIASADPILHQTSPMKPFRRACLQYQQAQVGRSHGIDAI